ncbi:MAG: response regulator [Chloroflexi bacterium]|nr:response regulator [Chloroflexota bacterium]
MAHILVIDDDTGVQQMLRLMLERGGHTVAVAGRGQEGLDTLRAESFDLVVCDVMMPDMDGYEVTRQIRADPQRKDVLVLVLTARGQLVDQASALEAGADAHLTKPVNPQQLNDQIAKMIAAGRPAQVASAASGRVIVCLGLRGGVGATTLAANLGALFIRAKRRVCLVDLSPAAGHLALHFRLRSSPNWADLPPAPDPQTLGSCLVKHETGLFALASPPRPMRHSLAGPTFETALTGLRTIFSEIVIDAAPVLDDPTLIALQSAAAAIVVLTPEVASVHTVTGTLPALAENSIADGKTRLVLNHVTSEANLPQAAVEKALNRALDAVVPYDRAQLAAMMQGAPLALSQPASPLVNAVGQFAAKL